MIGGRPPPSDAISPREILSFCSTSCLDSPLHLHALYLMVPRAIYHLEVDEDLEGDEDLEVEGDLEVESEGEGEGEVQKRM